jgi:hypothetical protein
VKDNSGNEIIFPSQCKCGHLYLEQYIVRLDANTVRPFCWCGFCRTRLNLRDREVRQAEEAPK